MKKANKTNYTTPAIKLTAENWLSQILENQNSKIEQKPLLTVGLYYQQNLAV